MAAACAWAIPALFIKMSSLPWLFSTVCAAALMDSSEVTSIWMGSKLLASTFTELSLANDSMAFFALLTSRLPIRTRYLPVAPSCWAA